MADDRTSSFACYTQKVHALTAGNWLMIAKYKSNKNPFNDKNLNSLALKLSGDWKLLKTL